MGKRKKGTENARIFQVTGYLVLDIRDEASKMSLAEIAEDGKEGLWGLGELDELSITELHGAVVTKKGIRTDVVG